MDNFSLDDFFEKERPRSASARSKPVRRKWREIEMLKDRARLRKELADIDILLDTNIDELDF